MLPYVAPQGKAQLADKHSFLENAAKDKNGSPKKHQILDPKMERRLPEVTVHITHEGHTLTLSFNPIS